MTALDDIPVMPPFDELPETLRVLRDDRHRKFVWAYMMGGANGQDSARWAGFSDVGAGSAKVRASVLLLRDDIQAAMRELGQRYLFNLMPKALTTLKGLLESQNPMDRGKAVERVLNRVKGFAEQNKIEMEVKGEITVNHTTAALEDLRSLLALGVSREKLIETFGASGLARYESMLAIEHRSDEGQT